MLYFITETNYDNDSETFKALIEGDGNPHAVIDVWRVMMSDLKASWSKTNPQPPYPVYPQPAADDSVWINYAQALRAERNYAAIKHQFYDSLEAEHGRDKLACLLKAGFKLVECKEVSI